ncbi:MAG: 30S ribosomal protein S20 [Candidatus Woykebacteria bacterium]
MPIIKSAKKKLRADLRKKVVNIKVKDKFKAAIKAYRAKPSNDNLANAYSALDTAAKKGIIPKKRADRSKSRLSGLLPKTKSSKTNLGSGNASTKTNKLSRERPSQKVR